MLIFNFNLYKIYFSLINKFLLKIFIKFTVNYFACKLIINLNNVDFKMLI